MLLEDRAGDVFLAGLVVSAAPLRFHCLINGVLQYATCKSAMRYVSERTGWSLCQEEQKSQQTTSFDANPSHSDQVSSGTKLPSACGGTL